MSQFTTKPLLEDVPSDEPWPPIHPDVDTTTIQVETPELVITANCMLYKIKGHPTIVYKFRGQHREYQLQTAAGNCAIPVRGKVLGKPKIGNGKIYFYGFLMDLATPIFPPTALTPSQRRDVMHQMIHTLQQLHAKGIVHGDVKLENMLLDNQGKLRLCDFGEGRYVDEDEHVWDGCTTMHFESPNRLRRGEEFGRDPPPPTVEDDLYGLGLSIWQLYTGGIPHEDLRGDDLDLKEKQQKGETVDVDAVHDQEARDVIISLLRKGGARI